jgi:hypothetical protein
MCLKNTFLSFVHPMGTKPVFFQENKENKNHTNILVINYL